MAFLHPVMEQYENVLHAFRIIERATSDAFNPSDVTHEAFGGVPSSYVDARYYKDIEVSLSWHTQVLPLAISATFELTFRYKKGDGIIAERTLILGYWPAPAPAMSASDAWGRKTPVFWEVNAPGWYLNHDLPASLYEQFARDAGFEPVPARRKVETGVAIRIMQRISSYWGKLDNVHPEELLEPDEIVEISGLRLTAKRPRPQLEVTIPCDATFDA